MKELKLHGKLAAGRFAVVDDNDFGYINQFRWFFNGRYIYRRNCTNSSLPKTVLLHREIMGFPVGKLVDHEDRNPFNNTKRNLRVCSSSQNNVNRGKINGTINNFKGVNRSGNGAFKAEIKFGGKQIYIGSFYSELYASYAFDIASLIINEEFSSLNHDIDYSLNLNHWIELIEFNRTGNKNGHNFVEKVKKIGDSRRNERTQQES